MSTLTNAAIREIHQLQIEADNILRATDVSRAEQKRADVIISRISSIRATGFSTEELNRTLATEQARELGAPTPRFETRTAEQRLYKKFLQGVSDEILEREFRDAAPAFIAGSATLGYSQGPNAGFVVPMQYLKEVVEGQKLVSPLLNPDVVTVVQETAYSHRPLQIPSWDLSGIAAVKLGETTGQTPSSIPSLQQPLLNTFRYNVSFNMSVEFEEDAASGYGPDPIDALSRANGVALARGINTDLISGDGVTGPQGILNATDSGVVTAGSNVVAHDDLSNVFYSVDRVYRNSPKCAWLVTDAVEKQIRNMKDTAGRPLFPTSDGVLNVFGKPLYSTPDLPLYNASLGTQAAGSFCVFGDLSKYVVHASAVFQRRFTQTPGLVEAGLIRLHSQQLIDAVVVNPSPSASPAIVTARLKS
jgi:HK97 family phage major capsid protein